MKGSKSSGAPLSNIASRVRPQGGANLGNSSPGTEGLSNIANRAVTPKGFDSSSPEFGTLGTVTQGVRNRSGKTNAPNKKSPGI